MRRQELGKEQAQKIVHAIMEIIPFNVHIMDTRGYIIASGDKSRLNTLHLGAVHALSQMQPIEVFQDCDGEHKGVNFPIVFGEALMGIIGISGEPEEVMHIGNIVAAMARMMIETQVLNDIALMRENRLRDFLNDWILLKKQGYQEAFYDRARAVGVTVSRNRVAAIITCRRVRFSVFDQIKNWLEPGEYVVRQSDKNALLLLNEGDRLYERVGRIMRLNQDLENCYLGEPSIIVNESLTQAQQTMQVIKMMERKERIVTFSSIALEYGLSLLQCPPGLLQIVHILQKSAYSKDLVNTIIAYAHYNHDLKELCSHLHIHRNTLNYRLLKIEESTGKNPKRMRDLMELYSAVIHLQQMKYEGSPSLL